MISNHILNIFDQHFILMIEQDRQIPNQFEEFQFGFESNDPTKKKFSYQHQPKRLNKKEKKAFEEKAQKQKNDEDKRKLKIEQKIYKKVVQEANDKMPQAPTQGQNSNTVRFQVDGICNILKYFLGEFGLEGKTQYESAQHKTCQKWQVDEIMKQVSDTNLGDFIIKCPNPDNLPNDWKDKYDIKQVDGALQSAFKQIKISQAMQFFYDLFDIQGTSKVQGQRENVAFLIAFYFLKFKNCFQQEAKVDSIMADTFLKVYNFYKLIEKKELKQYIQMRQQQSFQQKHQYLIRQMFVQQFQLLKCFEDGASVQDHHEYVWKDLKNNIYSHLNTQLIKNFGDQEKDYNQECRILFGKVKSVSQLLATFPQLVQLILDKIKSFEKKQSESDDEQENIPLKKQEGGKLVQQQKNKGQSSKKIPLPEQSKKQQASKEEPKKKKRQDNGKRLLFGGQYLKKTIVGQNVIWINTKGRPTDVATLLRFCLLYKLVIKAKLYIRMFLNRDQTHIMLVIKSSQQILQNYAQKHKLLMEVELGASDLFSFEPVDEYMRPLRKHKYITDTEFQKKYKIKKGAQSTNAQELLSIQSQAINIYQKSQLMNQDELRSLVIKDQFVSDDLFQWVSKRLQINYIFQKVLNNDYNKDNTDRQTWQLYYVYNKMIIAFIKRVQGLYSISRKEKKYYAQLEGNVGMLLRLMFLKALNMCNQMFYEHREVRSAIPRMISNIWTSKQKLQNIWNYLEIAKPSGFCTYYKMNNMERLWRKFQINQLKVRSKFFASQRLVITNRVIQDTVNMSISLQKKHIIDYYPLHDPFTLKSIQIQPYLSVIRNIKKAPRVAPQEIDASLVNKLYSQYQCDLSVADFIKKSVQKQLQFKFFSFKTFETSCIRMYCGQKIAFYFVLIKFLALKAWPLLLPAFIIQCLLWKQNGDVLSVGSSSITSLNNILIVIWTFINLFWTTNLIQSWKNQERTLAQQFGVTQITTNQIKRVKFKGSFKRDFQTDQLNFEYVPKWKSVLKGFFTLVINLAYIALVTEVILLLFVFKTYLYQSGYSQTVVQQGPTIMIAIATQIFVKLYTILIKSIINFQNHKTVTEYQGSLVSKVALITFVINFYSIFIYAYFSGYLASSYVCQIKTTATNIKITNCDYFVSSQLLSVIMVDFATTVIGGMTPYLLFKANQWWRNRSIVKTSKFNYSYFESIDSFYQEQDSLQTYMYNEELDSSWLGYMNIVNVFSVTALFAPALPFAYVMMFLTGLVRLHASKYDVIYLKKRILPTKTNSIHWWLVILQTVSYISIITNIAYMVYTRNVFPQYQGKIFFLFVILLFAIKYFILAQYNTGLETMAKRNQIKTNDILTGRGRQQYSNKPQEINTDIQNVIYDETKLKRKFHDVKGANVVDKYGSEEQEEQQLKKQKKE